ncbi:MAG: hypothetical protein NTX08_02570 [Sphingobacteriales bacterium]|nr:hypothetical protein [Sphingobacteriales bacterium]
MTTYLTKTEEGKTHHFRVTSTTNGVDIVHGIFYNWLGKYFEGCSDPESAITKQKELVGEKIKEGFQITEFKETLENSIDVYDKAKWHFSGDFPQELDIFQGYVHTGMFLGWLINNGLVSKEFWSDNKEDIKAFEKRQLTGSQIYERCCDGVLMLDDISEEGNRFALAYFDFDKGQYLADYEKTLLQGAPSIYHIADTWENFDKLKKVLNKRFFDSQNILIKKPFWKIW